ncbi:MAG: small subunit ribosomal protein [Solirubrobacteraceae bacterium]
MADDRTPADDETPQEPTAGEEQPTEEAPAEPEAAEEQPTADEPAADEPAAPEPAAPEREAVEAAAAQEPVAETLAASEDGDAEESAAAEEPAAEQPAPAEPAAEQPAPAEAAAEQPAPAAAAPSDDEGDDDEEPTPRVKPEIPGADLEVDIVTEGTDLYGRGESSYDEDEEPEPTAEEADDVPDDQPIAAVTIDLAAGARYRATGKRKTAVARVTLRPGDGSYVINGRTLDEFFPRGTLQRNIRQPLEAVGYETRMDVVARMHGGGVSAQAGALRHGISRALLEADPNLRGELKRRGFLTRDPRVKERKKAGLKKARKRPQFSKR